MININQEVLKSFLLENDIYIIGKYFKNKGENIDISNHIDIIINLQKVLMRYHSIEKNSILSEIGKRIDRIGVMAKKLDERFYDLSYYEKCVLDKVKEQLRKIENVDYIDLYKRGLLKDEVCIERVDESNLRVLDRMEIGKIKNINFNIIEDDFIDYLSRYKKIYSKEILREYAKEYVQKANLKKNSFQYINLMVDLPIDSLKHWYKNRYEWKGENISEFKAIAEKELNF